ncbi:biotin--[acetyl-CoA-carboxylase] ligase [Verrucomicrobia bacterium LW23]|nr:biotin--[acetyl-CoA-carboxylase] ligase [Verrucomicrobia bacterium LW23]
MTEQPPAAPPLPHQVADDIWCPDAVLALCRSTGPGMSAGSAPAVEAPMACPWQVLLFHETASTNDVALREAVHGAPAGLVVAAAAQSAGRGRQGRAWVSPRGAGLYVSFLLRPALEAAHASRLTAIAAVAAARAMDESLAASGGPGIRTAIKWPNDLHVHGRKAGGILIEAAIHGGRISHAVIGIGINVHHRRDDFPPELSDTATSLALALALASGGEERGEPSSPLRRVELLARLMDNMANSLATPFETLRAEWESRCSTLGRTITIRQPDGTLLQGTAAALDDTGVLHVEDYEGRTHRVHAGEVLG